MSFVWISTNARKDEKEMNIMVGKQRRGQLVGCFPNNTTIIVAPRKRFLPPLLLVYIAESITPGI